MKWRSIKDDPPVWSDDSSWYLVRSDKGVPRLALLASRHGLALWNSEDPHAGDAMEYDEWLEVPK